MDEGSVICVSSMLFIVTESLSIPNRWFQIHIKLLSLGLPFHCDKSNLQIWLVIRNYVELFQSPDMTLLSVKLTFSVGAPTGRVMILLAQTFHNFPNFQKWYTCKKLIVH